MVMKFAGVLLVFAAASARGEVVHFNAPEEYETRFYDNSTAPVFAWGAGFGVRAERGYVRVADEPRVLPTALYREPLDLSEGVRHEVSAYFYTAFTNQPGVVGRLGFAPSAGGNFSGGQPWVAVSLRNGAGGEGSTDYGDRFGLVASHSAGGNVLDDPDEATSVANSFSLFSGHWYKLATGFTYSGGGAFDYDATLTDYGRIGSSPDLSSVQSISGSLTDGAFSDPSSVAAMFAGVRADAPLTGAWDEFDARAVPEPGMAAVAMASGTVGLLLRRRRHRQGA